VEFSLAETYAVNQNAFGEIILELSPVRGDGAQMKDYYDDGVYIAMRFINCISFLDGTVYTTDIESHYPLLRRNLKQNNSLEGV